MFIWSNVNLEFNPRFRKVKAQKHEDNSLNVYVIILDQWYVILQGAAHKSLTFSRAGSYRCPEPLIWVIFSKKS